MTEVWNTLSRQWQDAVNTVLGLWLVIAPWALGYTTETAAMWNAIILGVIIAVAAVAALVSFYAWEEWVNAALGAWLIVSPWILGFAGLTAALWNQIIVGFLVGGLAIWAAMTTREQTAHA